MNFLKRRFGLEQAGTTFGREITAGLVTFCSLSYILFVQPAVLSHPAAGMDPGGVLFATCIASALACFLMGGLANLPVALAPAMGHNFFLVFTVCLVMGFSWQEALAANLCAGLFFLLLSRSGFRERVMEAVPAHLVAAIAVGIGLLIALIGLEWGGLLAAHPVTFVRLGDLGSPVALLTLFGLAINAVLLARKVPAAILVGLFLTLGAGLLATRIWSLEPALVLWNGFVGSPPSPEGTAFELDLAGLFRRPWTDWLAVIFIFLVLDLFDTIGSLLGLGRQAGWLKEGKLPGARAALFADAVGTTVGALLGTSTVTTYIESAAGIRSGGRTGLTAIVVGFCFLAALVFTPLIQTIGGGVPVGGDSPLVHYPIIAPVLVLVGAMMMGAVKDINWGEESQAIPAFLTIVFIPLSFSITDGLAIGFIATSLLSLATGKLRSVSWLLHSFSLVFVLRYLYLYW